VTPRNGTKVKTGTSATFLHDMASCHQGERGAIEKEMLLAIRALPPLGLFDYSAHKNGRTQITP